MKTKLIILGCGNSMGTPRIDGYWGDCDKKNKKNYRTRCSAIIVRGSNSILIDTSPDIRKQLLDNKISAITSVVYTHEHSDQTNGLFELRPFAFEKKKGKIIIYNDAKKAAKDADIIFADKVVSLNDKVNKSKKIKDFKNFKVNSELMSVAKKDVIFLHCLPRGSEVTDDVFLGKQSKVWQQALNRVYVQKSILLYCFGKLR